MADREFNGNNPYYSPEKCGLRQLGSLEGDLSYEFDMVVVWEDVESDQLYWGHDSGCSCPAPFEDVRRLSDLQELSKANLYSFTKDCEELSGVDKAECASFINSFRVS